LLKKKLHTALKFILCCIAAIDAHAQLPTSVTLSETVINAQTTVDINTVKVGFIIIGGDITVKGSPGPFLNVDFPVSPSMDLGVLNVKAVYNGLIALGYATEIQLSTDPKHIFNGLGLLGDTYVNYRIPIAGRAWLAGKYQTTLIYSAPLSSPLFTITVSPYLTKTSTVPLTTALLVNSFDMFRSNGISSGDIGFGYGTTLPTEVQVKAKNTSDFTFAPSYATAEVIVPPASTTLKSALTTPVGLTKSITSNNQLISLSSGLPVVVTNKRNLNTAFSISAADLKASFKRAGIYKIPVTYTINNTNDYLGSASSTTMETSVEVTVPGMSDIKVPVSNVSLDFNNRTAYTAGVTAGITNQVKFSSTVPYNITVKSTSTAFTNTLDASTIPLSVVTIEGMSGQTGITPIVLSTLPQAIITNGTPVIDQSLNLQYRIPAAQITNIMGKTQGTYNATIVYTIVAP